MTTLSADAPPRLHPLRWYARGLWRYLCVPALMMGGIAWALVLSDNPSDRGFFDFKGGLWQAGRAILHGRDPYRAAYIAHQAAIMHGGGIAVGETASRVFSVPLYPAFANLAVVPLSLMPFGVAATVYSLLSIGAMAGSLALLGVRDWRCHVMWIISWPFLFGLILGAIGPFIMLGVAAAWRWRDRLWPPALAVAAVVALKIFPWTLGVWLLVTRRYRACALAIASGLALTFGAWAIIGFQGLDQYPRMLSNATYIQEGRADGVATVALVCGASARLAQAIALLAGVAVLALAWRVRRLPDGDRRAFGLVIIASLVSTPIVWDHYMVLLFVPIALLSPRFSRLWMIPVVFPTLIALSFVVFPLGPDRGAASTNALHYALGYLTAQAVLGVYLCTTPPRRAALGRRLGSARSPRAASGAAITG